jgi:hypothetical protein
VEFSSTDTPDTLLVMMIMRNEVMSYDVSGRTMAGLAGVSGEEEKDEVIMQTAFFACFFLPVYTSFLSLFDS